MNNQEMKEENINEVKYNKTYYIDTLRAKAWVIPNFISPSEANRVFNYLKSSIHFIQHTLYPGTNRERKQSRLSCQMGNSYPYSGSIHPSSPWDPLVLEIMNRINSEFGCNFNSCLINNYLDGTKYISPHCDDERELGDEGQVVSVSLGAQRNIIVTSKVGSEKYSIPLPPGSLFMMEGKDFQKKYLHGIPKGPASIGQRISLTFRCFKSNNNRIHNNELTFF